MKKSIISGFLAIALTLSLTACSDNKQSGQTGNTGSSSTVQLEKPDFNLGYLNSTAHLLAFVSAEEGYFKEEGLNVTLTQFSSASELSSALRRASSMSRLSALFPRLHFRARGTI